MNHFEIFLTEGQIFLTGQRENKTNKVLPRKHLTEQPLTPFCFTNLVIELKRQLAFVLGL